MSYKQPPRYTPTDLAIPVAGAVYEEDNGTTSYSVPNTRFPNDPNGQSSTCDKLSVAAIILILILLILILRGKLIRYR